MEQKAAVPLKKFMREEAFAHGNSSITERESVPLQPRRGVAPPEKGEYVYLSSEALSLHPRNLRRVYRDKDVQKMAASIRKRKGVDQALLIVASERAGHYYVVDGNIRLAGAKLLGVDSPKLKCEIVTASEAEQYLIMAVTGEVRFTPDPISQALNFKRLIAEQGFTPRSIAEASGIHKVTVENRLALLRLDPEIQHLVAEGRLPVSEAAVEAFLGVPNKEARIKLADRMARDGASVKTIVASCGRLTKLLAASSQEHPGGGTAPALGLCHKRAGGRSVPEDKTLKWSTIRKVAKEICQECEMRLKEAPEPLWTMVVHSVEETCGFCRVREVSQACVQCPAVDIVQKLLLSCQGRAAKAR